ncbi:MAG TPA: surface-adhesin E family protein [Burkholderiales bacterium]
MRYLLLVCVLVCANARAQDWVQISSDYESSIYFDRAGLKRDGDAVETLLLWDFATLQLTRRPVKPYLSATRLTRFDCAKGGRANIETTLYRENMAKGDVTDVYRTPEADISYEWVNPEAPGGESLRQVCAAAGK